MLDTFMLLQPQSVTQRPPPAMQVGALRCCECGQDLVGVFDPQEVKEAHVTMSPSCSIARGGQAPDVGGTPKGAYNVRGGLILGAVSLQWPPPPPISLNELGISGLNSLVEKRDILL